MSTNIFQHAVFPTKGNRVKIERKGRSVRIEVEDVGANRIVIEVDVDDADLYLKGLHRG